MAKKLDSDPRPRFDFSEVRDWERLFSEFDGVDCIVHGAATKIIPTAKYNPFECNKTNVNGAKCVLMRRSMQVQGALSLSTYEARRNSHPISSSWRATPTRGSTTHASRS